LFRRKEEYKLFERKEELECSKERKRPSYLERKLGKGAVV